MSVLAPPAAPLTPAEEESNVEVTREDQSRINEFGRLNARKMEIKDEVVEAKKKIEDLSDAEEAAMLADESTPGAIKILIGDCFVDVESSYATTYIEEQKNNAKNLIDSLESELLTIEARQGELKKLLYGKFGKSINLEDR